MVTDLQARRNVIAVARRGLGAVTIVASTVVYAYRNVAMVLRHLEHSSGDFAHYWAASRALLTGADPFAVPGFNYPPLLAVLLAPLAVLPQPTARLVWFALSHLFLIAAAVGLARKTGGVLARWVVAMVWVFGGTVAQNLAVGQVNPLLLLLIVLAWPGRASSGPRAAWIGVAAGLKLWPGLILFREVLFHRRRALLLGVVSTVVLILVPWVVILARGGGSTPVGAGYWAGTPAILNCSLAAVALRAADAAESELAPSSWRTGTSAANFRLDPRRAVLSVSVALGVAVIGLVSLLIMAGPHREEELVTGSLVTLALIVSPVSWYHYQLLELPVVVFLLHRFVGQRAWFKASAVTAAAILATWGHSAVGFAVDRLGWGGPSVLLSTVSALTTLGACLLFVLSLWAMGSAPSGIKRVAVQTHPALPDQAAEEHPA